MSFYTISLVGNRYQFLNPSGNQFYYIGCMNVNPNYDGNQFNQPPYNGNSTVWAHAQLLRLISWNFKATDYSSYYTEIDPAALPWGLIFKPRTFAVDHPQMGAPWNGNQIPDLWNGLSAAIRTKYGFQVLLMDVYDPIWAASCDLLVNQIQTGSLGIVPPLGDFKTITNMIFISCEDADDFSPLRAVGSDYINIGYATACVTPFSAYAVKQAWVTFLQLRYHHDITLLNAAWGSSYTGFSGGGTTVANEDGTHGWTGDNDATLTDGTANAGFISDCNLWVYQYSKTAFGAMVSSIRAYDTNHLLGSANFMTGNPGNAPNLLAIQACKDVGINFIHMRYEACVAQRLSDILNVYTQIGLPILCWYSISANNDSPYAGDPSAACDYTNQTARASQYGIDLRAMFSAVAVDGNHPILGTNWWDFLDITGETTNFGLVVSDVPNGDKPYDGTAPYGNFLAGVTLINSSIPPSPTAGPGTRLRIWSRRP